MANDQLRQKAQIAGSIAAEDYIRRGDRRKPPMDRPVTLTQRLTDVVTPPTDDELTVVEVGWNEGWDERWASEHRRRVN